MSAQPGYIFLGKVEYAENMKDGIKIARRMKPTAGRLDLWTDQSSREDSYKVGLAVAFKRHDYKEWREHYDCREPDYKMGSKESELEAVEFGLQQGRRWLRDDGQLDLYCEVKDVVDRIRDYQPGDGGWGEVACAKIHQCVAEIQQGKRWTEEGVPCVVKLALVKAHAHENKRGGDGGPPIMGNCWANFWASVAVDGGQSKEQDSHQSTRDIQARATKRLKEDREEVFSILEKENASFQAALAKGEVEGDQTNRSALVPYLGNATQTALDVDNERAEKDDDARFPLTFQDGFVTIEYFGPLNDIANHDVHAAGYIWTFGKAESISIAQG